MSEYRPVEGNCPLNRVESDDVDCSVLGYSKSNQRLGKSYRLVIVLLVCEGGPVVGLVLPGQCSQIRKFRENLPPEIDKGVGLF